MNVETINPFIEATLYIIDTSASAKVMPLSPYLKKGTSATGDISSMIEMSGDCSGTAAVSFSKESILGIVSKMFGEEMTELDDEIKDAVGEISNMIAGHVTNKLGEQGKTAQIKFTSVVMGKNDLTHLPGKPVIAVPFRTEKGSFTIEVCFAE